ncbi:MAG: flagellar FliJ family protein [Magnetospirillum sp.]
MAKQAKGLKTLIRLSKFDVDEKRRVLTALQNQEEQILHDILQSEVQLRKEQELASSDAIGVGFIYGAYHRAWMDQRQMLFNRLATIRQQIELARDELAEAFRTQKTYEVTQANRERREQQELDRKEQAFLDEVAQTQHRRRENHDD